MTNQENIRYCPNCNKVIDPCFLFNSEFFKYSFSRLDLPYFLCGNCRLAYVDKKLIQKAVSDWRKRTNAHKYISHKDAYKKALKFVEEQVRYLITHTGYEKIVRFNKAPRK